MTKAVCVFRQKVEYNTSMCCGKRRKIKLDGGYKRNS